MNGRTLVELYGLWLTNHKCFVRGVGMKADNMQIQVQEFGKKVEQVFIWTYQCAVWVLWKNNLWQVCKCADF